MESFKIYNFVPQVKSPKMINTWNIKYERGKYFTMFRVSNNNRSKIEFSLTQDGSLFRKYIGNYSGSKTNERITQSSPLKFKCNGYGQIFISDGPIEKKRIKFHDIVLSRFKDVNKISVIKPIIVGEDTNHERVMKGDTYSKELILSKDTEYEILSKGVYYYDKVNRPDKYIFPHDDYTLIRIPGANGFVDVNVRSGSLYIVNVYQNSNNSIVERVIGIGGDNRSLLDCKDDITKLIEVGRG